MAGRGPFFGFEAIQGRGAEENPTAQHFRLAKNRQYTSLVQVRNGEVKAYLDDALISDWKTNYSDLGPWTHWKLRDINRLGIGTHNTESVIREVEVLEITGKGLLLRPPKPGFPSAGAGVR